MTEQRKNSYDEDDLAAVVEQIEGHEATIRTIMAKAMNEAAQYRRKIGDIKKEAKDHLGIPPKPLNALLKTRKHERKILDVADDVPDDFVEIFEDMVGQLSFLAPEKDGQSPAQVAAQKRRTAAEENEAREQEEGSELIDGLVN